MGHWRKSFCGLMIPLIPAVLAASEGPREVPFKLYRGYSIVVRGEVGGIKKLNFLLDTGAEPSVIDVRLARRLRLEGQSETLSVFSRSVEAQKIVLPELRVGPVRADGTAVLVHDLAFIEEGLGVRIDGLIGLDVLGRESFSIDYEAGKLRFGPILSTGSSVNFEPGSSYVVVKFQPKDSPLRLLVDTGTNHLILFEERARSHFPPLRTRGTKSLSNMGGAIVLDQVELPDARLGESTLPSQTALLLRTPSGAPGDFDGLLGVAALGAKRVDFDFERRVLSWTQ